MAVAAGVLIGGGAILGFGYEDTSPQPAAPRNGDGRIECDKRAPKETVTLIAGKGQEVITATWESRKGVNAGESLDVAYVNVEFVEATPGVFQVNTVTNDNKGEKMGDYQINSPTFEKPLVQPGTLSIGTIMGDDSEKTEKVGVTITVTQEQNNLPADQTVVGVTCAATAPN